MQDLEARESAGTYAVGTDSDTSARQLRVSAQSFTRAQPDNGPAGPLTQPSAMPLFANLIR
jgi:hypothetical protein